MKWVVISTTDGCGSREEGSVYHAGYSLFDTKEAACSACESLIIGEEWYVDSYSGMMHLSRGENVLLVVPVTYCAPTLHVEDDE